VGTTISAADANRKFSMMLRRVREGHSYVVTSHGRPVARIVPVDTDRVSATARATLLERLKAAPVLTIDRWTRDDLYEEQ
jgi:prevent-host-death family protein